MIVHIFFLPILLQRKMKSTLEQDIKFNGRDQLAILSFPKHSELPNSEHARLLDNSE